MSGKRTRQYFDASQYTRCWLDDDGTIGHSAMYGPNPNHNSSISDAEELRKRLTERLILVEAWIARAKDAKWGKP